MIGYYSKFNEKRYLLFFENNKFIAIKNNQLTEKTPSENTFEIRNR